MKMCNVYLRIPRYARDYRAGPVMLRKSAIRKLQGREFDCIAFNSLLHAIAQNVIQAFQALGIVNHHTKQACNKMHAKNDICNTHRKIARTRACDTYAERNHMTFAKMLSG